MQQHSYFFFFSLLVSSLFLTNHAFAGVTTPEPLKPTKIIPHGWVWEQITVGQDDNLTLIFLRVGLTEQDVYRITHTLEPAPDALLKLKPGQKIQFALNRSDPDSPQLQGLRLITKDVSDTLEIITMGTGFVSSNVSNNNAIPENNAEIQTTTPESDTGPETATLVPPSPPLLPSSNPNLITVPTQQDIAQGLIWKEAIVKKDDNLTRLFLREGLTEQDVYRVIQSKPEPKALLNLIPGQTVRLALDNTDDGALALHEIQLKINAIQSLSVTNSDTGFITKTETRDIEYRELETHAEIISSLFMAGKKVNLTDKVILELASLFNWDIDFALDIRENDSFSLIYQQGYVDGEALDDVTILAAEFINQGRVYRAVRYTNAEDETGYFTPEGESMRKAFIRTPLDFTRISSPFNLNRRHPILNTIRAHKGVDYAASRGTPIKATGKATIQSIGNQRGYGRTIVLKHAGSYTTLYAHMNSFVKGLRKGSRVKQGQVIGYVGSSGLATGPHLHYEFRVNGVHRNPLTVKLPRSISLAEKYQADFKVKAQSFVTKLDNLNQPSLARNQSE